MTLDEAIKHAEEVAEEKESEGKLLCQSEGASIGCLTCAKEHRQLAEWFKELKQLREQTRWIPVSERLPERNMECLVAVGKFNFTQMAVYSDLMKTLNHRIFYQGDYGKENFEDITQYVNAWIPSPKSYKPESEGEEMTSEELLKTAKLAVEQERKIKEIVERDNKIKEILNRDCDDISKFVFIRELYEDKPESENKE